VKSELAEETRWIEVSTNRIQELAEREKLVKMQDILACLNNDKEALVISPSPLYPPSTLRPQPFASDANRVLCLFSHRNRFRTVFCCLVPGLLLPPPSTSAVDVCADF
jgi:hypothetical protein